MSSSASPFVAPSAEYAETTESSPPRKSNSGRDIEYAPGLLPNGGGLAPPVIGYHAPKTSSLLQGQMREPADVGRFYNQQFDVMASRPYGRPHRRCKVLTGGF
uniref:Uncharacterized protein n=1 Tax=Oryza sativa subsp. japonica TaxID=39947 RepID=Q2QVA4_ORYSJ|nr:hypothetical protein LOC_Os12g13490 [Oryza sativa Japonica Group]